jgi:hypothetical protein
VNGNHTMQRSIVMKSLNLRFFALGLMAAALLAAALAADVRASAVTDPREQAAARSVAQSPDQVVQWNRILLGILRTPGAQPATVHPTRSMALLHAAVYDAVNAIVKTHADYLVHLNAPRHASVAAAAAQAAHDTLVGLYPAQAAALDSDLDASLASVPESTAKDQGVRVGAAAASRILALRSNDGSSAASSPFTPGTGPGEYQPTPPAFSPPVFTHWRFVAPFVIRSAGEFRPDPPPALTSTAYLAAFDEVKSLGEIGSTTRTADQTQIARFWNAPIQNYWNEIAQTAALQHRDTLPQNARLFALLDLTLADSVIAFYDAKYTYHFWRPVTAVRADAASSGWTPLAPTALDPSYPGAHAVVSAAGAEVLRSFFRSDRDNLAVTSEVLPGIERSFPSFSAAAAEASDSRIFAGQHFRTDEVAGQRLGRNVADYVLRHALLARR